MEFFSAFTALTLFGSFVTALIFIGLFLFVCLLSEIYENGIPSFIALIVISIFFFSWGNIDSISYIFSVSNILMYLGAGLAYSILRTVIYGRHKTKKLFSYGLNHGETEEEGKNRLFRELKDDLSGHVFRWFLMWPISLLKYIFGDLLSDIWQAFYRSVRALYESLLRLGINSITKTTKL